MDLHLSLRHDVSAGAIRQENCKNIFQMTLFDLDIEPNNLSNWKWFLVFGDKNRLNGFRNLACAQDKPPAPVSIPHHTWAEGGETTAST